MKAKVKWFDTKKGFGFILMEGGKDAFVHHTHIQGTGFKDLTEGDEVECDIIESEKGIKAVNVVIVKQVKTPIRK